MLAHSLGFIRLAYVRLIEAFSKLKRLLASARVTKSCAHVFS